MAEELEALEEEVRAMEAEVRKMRAEGPERFRSLLENHLHKLRPPPQTGPIDQVPLVSVEGNGEIAALQQKLSAAMDCLPQLLERINKCTADLDSRLVKLKHKKSFNLVFDQAHADDEISSRISSST